MGLEDNRQIILVTGGDGGYGNLGDEWLADSVRARYKKIKQKYRVIFLMQCPKTNSDGFFYALDNKESFRKMSIPIDRIKAVHFYGGGYMNNYWMDEKLWLYDYLLDKGLSGSNIFFTGIGLGPLNREELAITKKISKNVNFFGARDKSFGFRIKSRFMFDESVFFAPYLSKVKKKNKLLVNFRMADHVGVDEENISKLLEKVRSAALLGKIHMSIEYFPMIDDIWFDEKKEMIKMLKINGMPYDVLNRPSDYIELIELVQSASLVITTSYHVALASLYVGTPALAIFGNDYYRIKFTNLKKVLSTRLLKVVNISQLDDGIIDRCIMAKDGHLTHKINKLKLLSDRAYKKYEVFLGVS